MTKGFIRVTALGAALALSGCTVFPVPEPPRLMELAPANSSTESVAPVPATLRVDTPLASDPLDSTRILIKPTAYEFKALPGARWRDSMPVVIRDYLIQNFRKNQVFASVITDTSPATAEYTLITELSGFHARQVSNGNQVVIETHTELMENRSRESLCVLDQREEVLAASARAEDLAEAFSEASAKLSEKLNRWARDCLKQG